jgi:hypothetical protein
MGFIIGGGLFEEFLENIGLKIDHDPVVKIDDIAKIGDYVNLDVNQKELKSKLEEDVIPESALLYSRLKGMKVLDSDNKSMGKINGLIFLPCLQVAFLVSGAGLNKLSKALAISQEWDLLLPTEDIVNILKDKIATQVSQTDLRAVLNKEIMDMNKAKEYLDSIKERDTVSLVALGTRYSA